MDDSSTEINSYSHSVYEESIASESTHHNHNNIGGNSFEPNCYRLKRKIDGKQKKILLFPSQEHVNAHMINAITGIPYYNDDGPYQYKIGSVQEDDVFKVKFLTGENKIPPITLCYDSPEQYEKHLSNTVDGGIKEKWYRKNQAYKMRMKMP
jgi:hypothetical protein